MDDALLAELTEFLADPKPEVCRVVVVVARLIISRGYRQMHEPALDCINPVF